MNFKKFAFNFFIEVQNILFQDIPSPTEYGLNRDATGMVVQPESLLAIDSDFGSAIPGIGIVMIFKN